MALCCVVPKQTVLRLRYEKPRVRCSWIWNCVAVYHMSHWPKIQVRIACGVACADGVELVLWYIILCSASLSLSLSLFLLSKTVHIVPLKQNQKALCKKLMDCPPPCRLPYIQNIPPSNAWVCLRAYVLMCTIFKEIRLVNGGLAFPCSSQNSTSKRNVPRSRFVLHGKRLGAIVRKDHIIMPCPFGVFLLCNHVG
jgi:hypothetical protein